MSRYAKIQAVTVTLVEKELTPIKQLTPVVYLWQVMYSRLVTPLRHELYLSYVGADCAPATP